MAPEPFERCVKQGGRVRRKTLSGGRYINLCFIGGKSHAGYVHTKKGKGNPGAAVKSAAGKKHR